MIYAYQFGNRVTLVEADNSVEAAQAIERAGLGPVPVPEAFDAMGTLLTVQTSSRGLDVEEVS